MPSVPISPKLLKAGLVLLEPESGAVRRIVVMQYNPTTLTRSLQAQAGAEADRSEVMRLWGPPVETFQLEAEIDAADQLEHPGDNRAYTQHGIQPHLAALETILYPTTEQLQTGFRLAANGELEILPVEAPLTVFVWSKSRVAPVRLTDFSIEEQMFDPNLNPIQAKISLGMRVLSVNDFGFRHRGSAIYLAYQQQKERLAALHLNGSFGQLGIEGVAL